jgi:hypothetical protein
MRATKPAPNKNANAAKPKAKRKLALRCAALTGVGDMGEFKRAVI